MARDVEADVNVNDKSQRGLSSFLANLRKANDSVKETTKETDKASAATAKLGGKADENARAFHKLSSELEISKKELGTLARAFADAGTAAERNDISKAMRRQNTEIRNLTKNRDILKDLLPDEGEVQKEGQRLTQQFSKIFSEIGELGGPALAIGLAAAAPAIGASISGAIIGGAGLGGIVGGVVIAAKDARVQQAFALMKGEIGAELTDAAEPFVDTTIKGISEIGQAVEDINFKGIFADAAKQAAPIIDGVTETVTALGDAVEDLIHNSGPAVAAIGRGIGQIGQSIGDGLESLADNGQAGADALTNLFSIVSDGIGVTFGLVNALTEVYDIGRRFAGPGVVDAMRALNDASTPVGDKVKAIAESMTRSKGAVDQYGQAILTDGAAVESFTQKVDDLAASGRSLFDSATNVGAAIDNVTAAAKKNGKTLDENTAKGRANRSVLSDLAGSLTAKYDAEVKANGESTKSIKIALDNRATFIKLARQLGATATEAEAFATQLLGIPPKKDIKINVNTHDAEGRAQALKEKIDAIHSKTATIRVNAVYSQAASAVINGGIRPGGRFDASNSFLFAAAGATNRTEAPRQVTVDSRIDNTIYLDGRPFRAYTDRTVREANDRAAWRQRVGRR